MSAFAAGFPFGAAARHSDVPDTDSSAVDGWALVRRVQAGDRDAFGLIYDRYVDEIYRYVAHRVATRGLAEDLTSETFVRALRRVDRISWRGSDLGAWLVTIARNLIADHYKSGRHRLEISTGEIGPVADRSDRSGRTTSAPESPEDLVVAAATRAEGVALLVDLLGRLGDEQRNCVVMRFLRGMSVEETAAALGKNTSAVKALQYRAVRTLARMLPEGVTDESGVTSGARAR